MGKPISDGDDTVTQDEDVNDLGEQASGSDENQNEDGGEDNTPAKAKKNKSNWKIMKEELKTLRKENAALKASRSDDGDDSDEDEEPDEDDDEVDDEEAPISSRYAPLELQVKFLQDPEAKKLEKQIREVFRRYPDMKFADAKALAKASNPESETKRPLGLKTNATKAKDLTSLSEEEALNLPEAQYLEWGRKTGNIKER